MVNIILNLRSLRSPHRDSRTPEPPPLVSVLIPARNEEANIEACLESLCQQDYPNFEVLVLDDNSSDKTASIVSRIATQDNRIQLIRGAPLPRDWAGKPFACYQLAQRARGSWLLFVDADTIHVPNMLCSVLNLASEFKCSLLSGFPHQTATSLSQKVAIPLFYFSILSWIPLWWLQQSKEPKPSIAIGQFLLFPREEYWRIGGHRVVKSRIVEDLWLVAEVKRHGGRTIAVDLSPVVSCHMYQNVRAMWHGFAKSIYGLSTFSPVAFILLMAVAYIFFLVPFYSLYHELFIAEAPTSWRSIIILQVAVILLMRWLVDKHFKEPLVSSLLHPVGLSFYLANGLYAFSRRVVGAGIHWKQRRYDRESGID